PHGTPPRAPTTTLCENGPPRPSDPPIRRSRFPSPPHSRPPAPPAHPIGPAAARAGGSAGSGRTRRQAPVSGENRASGIGTEVGRLDGLLRSSVSEERVEAEIQPIGATGRHSPARNSCL